MVTPTSTCPKCQTLLPDGASFCPGCGIPTPPGGYRKPQDVVTRRLAEGETEFAQLKGALADRYVIEREIGRGGMATVYLAQDLKHHRKVAVKVLQAEISSLIGNERFLREIEITAQLQHPHILPLHDSGEAAGFLYYVMPFVEGESLRDRLSRDKRLSLEDALQIVREVAHALSYAHSRDVVHRDIKPENILLSAGHAQVADFGIARAISAAGTSTLTQTGAVIGTPAYMAPEQAVSAPDVDGRADLYALAAVACETLTGTRTDTLSDSEAAEQALLSARPDIKPSLAHALTAPLALDRDRRPASVDDWLDSLKAPERRLPSVTMLVTAAVTVAFLVAIVGWWILGSRPASAPTTPTIAVLPFSVTGEVEGIDLASALPQAFHDQLQWLPEHSVLSPERVRSAIVDNFGTIPEVDTATSFLASRFSASEVLWGTAQVTPAGELRLSVQVREGVTQRIVRSADTTGMLDSLHALVSGIVVEAFAEHVVGERAGWSPALPRGMQAINAYYAGEQHFRRGDYSEAIRRLDEVIERDSTYAPAYFKRMLAVILRTQPTRAGTAIRDALDAARRYKDGLDPTTQELLEGYEVLVSRGDVRGGQEAFRSVVDQHPDAVDARFILGYLKVNFPALIGTTPTAARLDFEQVYQRDPLFAAAIAQLARTAILLENRDDAQRYIGEYVALDSTSEWAELLRLADTLVFGSDRQRASAVGSLDDRPSIVLEMIGLTAGEFHQPGQNRIVAHEAISTLWERAATDFERRVAFRMQMASLLGTGQSASAERLMLDARRRGVPRQELDHWTVLASVTGVATLGDPETAAGRLLAPAADSATAWWLAARWYRARDPRAATDAVEKLSSWIAATDRPSPLALSLRDDLDAVELAVAGDAAGAIEKWREATQRYSIEEVLFGLVGSLWPLRLEWARVAAASGEYEEVILATEPFAQMAGFVDQAAWPEVWLLRADAYEATGDAIAAQEIREELVGVLSEANGEGAVLRDSLANLLPGG